MEGIIINKISLITMGFIISKSLSQKVVMTGVKYENNHPGGISSVVQYWSEYIERLQYYSTFQEGPQWLKAYTFITSYIKLFLRLFTEKKIEIVHIHTAAGTDFKRAALIINLAKKFNKKVVLHSHASQFQVYYSRSNDREKRWIIKKLRTADLIIALSESWKTWFGSLGVSPDKIVILHNITTYPQIKGNKELVNNRPIRFLFMGEIGQRKGVFDIIRAIMKHRDEIKEKIEFRIGGNKMETEICRVINDGGINEFVKFEGWVSGEKKNELLNWADVFILPSFNEGLPISILEAMSYKMPIISTPVGGIPEVVDEANGILVTPGNDEEIFSAIKYYVENRQVISVQGINSYKKVESYFPNSVLTHLRSIYEDLLK